MPESGHESHYRPHCFSPGLNLGGQWVSGRWFSHRAPPELSERPVLAGRLPFRVQQCFATTWLSGFRQIGNDLPNVPNHPRLLNRLVYLACETAKAAGTKVHFFDRMKTAGE